MMFSINGYSGPEGANWGGSLAADVCQKDETYIYHTAMAIFFSVMIPLSVYLISRICKKAVSDSNTDARVHHLGHSAFRPSKEPDRLDLQLISDLGPAKIDAHGRAYHGISLAQLGQNLANSSTLTHTDKGTYGTFKKRN
ncbi:MAG: hypothetical protein WCG42_08705 [Parachlamydiaceae bacterium]